MKYYLLPFFLLLAAYSAFAQKKHYRFHPETDQKEEGRYKGRAILLHLTYGGQIPGGDLKTRFGNNSAIGGGLEWIGRNNFSLGMEGHYFFGKTVKEDPIAMIRTDSGDIVANTRILASVALRERGYYVGGTAARLFTFGKGRRGIRLTLGAGVLRHKIRVQDDSRGVTQITGDYAKGYDRLCGGFALNEFVGYQAMSRSRTVNFFAGFEFNQGFTRTLRDWDFLAMRKLEGDRLDLRYGFKVGWTLPFFISGSEKIYY